MTRNQGIALGVAVVLVAGVGWQAQRRRLAIKAGSAPGRGGGGRPVPVETVRASRQSLRDEAEFSGTLSSRSRFVLAPKVSGRLNRLLFDIGDDVRRGDVVAVLDSAEYEQQVAQTQAELEVAQANLQEAQSTRAVAAGDLKRAEELHAEKIASEAQLDEARARDRAAAARVEVARAQIRQREAMLASAHIRLADTRLLAEWEGAGDARVIAERYANEGALLRANDPVVAVTAMDTLLAVVHVIERDFSLIQPGQSATLLVDAYPSERFIGHVKRRAPELDALSRHARVEIEVANPDRLLAPGMFARVRIQLAERAQAQVVPRAALARRNGEDGVFLVDLETRAAHFVPVTTGMVTSDVIEILEPDLNGGHVVTLGRHLLEDGGQVSFASGNKPLQTKGEIQFNP